jgi:hypothetical protein
MYGMMASLPNRGDLNELVLDVLDNLTQLDETAGALQARELASGGDAVE